MPLDIWEGKKAQNLIDSVNNVALVLSGLSNSDEHGLYFKNFRTIQALNRMGLASKVLSSYDYIAVNKETSMSISARGSGLSSPTIDPKTFIYAMGEALTKEYEFIYDGNAWTLGDEVVILSSLGVSVSGTPAKNDALIVEENAETIRYDIIGIDHDVPSDPNFTHTITLCRHECAHYSVLAYKKPQGLIYVDPTTFPNGLTAGNTYYVTSYYGSYANNTSEDGNFAFTPTINVPAGGLVKHTAIGLYQSSSANYNKNRILAGKFETFDTVENGRTRLESNIATIESDSGTYLGTVSAEDYSKRSASYCNMTRRNAYGSNAYIKSDERAWMNANTPSGLDSKGVPLWQSGKLGIFDLPGSYNAPGNLYGIDPMLLEVIGPVRKRTYLHSVDRSDQSVKHVDTDELVFPLSMTETGMGTTNDGVYENAVNLDGTVKTIPYEYFSRRTTAAERIKYLNGTARPWWFRSPRPSDCGCVRNCNSSGVLSDDLARNAYGAVDAYNIV